MNNKYNKTTIKAIEKEVNENLMIQLREMLNGKEDDASKEMINEVNFIFFFYSCGRANPFRVVAELSMILTLKRCLTKEERDALRKMYNED